LALSHLESSACISAEGSVSHPVCGSQTVSLQKDYTKYGARLRQLYDKTRARNVDFDYNFEIVNSGSEREPAAWLCSCMDCKAALPGRVNGDLTLPPGILCS
jgi:hypothetical protein